MQGARVFLHYADSDGPLAQGGPAQVHQQGEERAAEAESLVLIARADAQCGMGTAMFR